MSFLASLGGQLLGNFLGNAVSNAQSLNAYEKQKNIDYEFTKKLWDYQMQNKHQLEVGDLEAAGLNKILSATNGQAVNATPFGGSLPVQDNKLGSTALQLSIEQQKAEIAKTEAETNQIKADTDKQRLGVEKQDADTRLFLADTDYRRYLLDKSMNEANLGLIAAETGRTIAETQATYEGIERDWQEARSRIGLNNAQTEATYEQAALYRKEIEKAAKELGLTDEQIKNMSLSNDEIRTRLNDPDLQLRRIYRSSPIGLLTGMFGYLREDIIGGSVGASVPAGPKGMRVGAHY